MKKILFFLSVLSHFAAVSQVQLTDEVLPPLPLPSNPSGFFRFNNEVFFTASTNEFGNELWKTDGSAQGTSLVKDINLGSANSEVSMFTPFKDRLYFLANNGENEKQLWVTDGTSQGTKPVAADTYHDIHHLVATDDHLFFLRKTSATLMELWKWNGVAQEFSFVQGELYAFDDSYLTEALGLVFFMQQHYNGDRTTVWRSDGTSAGTYSVFDVDYAGRPVEFNGHLYLFGVSHSFENHFSGIVKTDGTIEGTSYLLDLDIEFFQPPAFTDAVVNEQGLYLSLFFLEENRLIIVESAGDPLSTNVIWDYRSSSSLAPSNLLSTQHGLYFIGGNTDRGTSLFRYVRHNMEVGSVENVKQLSEAFNPWFTPAMDRPSQIVAGDDDEVFISLNKSAYIRNNDLWVSRGSNATTEKLASIGPKDVIFHNNFLYFAGEGVELELWKTGGSHATTQLVKDINTFQQGAAPYSELIKLDHVVLGSSYTPDSGHELWVSDGTGSGSFTIDINPGEGSSYPFDFIAKDGIAYFLATGPVGGTQFYMSDGTAEGTRPVSQIETANVQSHDIVAVNLSELIFYGNENSGDYSYGLYALAQDELRLIKKFGTTPSNRLITLYSAIETEDRLFFLQSNDELWTSDGSTEGTVKVATFNSPYYLTAVGRNVFLLDLNVQSQEITLYKSDGTPNGTIPVITLPGHFFTTTLFAFKDQLIFALFDEIHGREIWMSDGTEEGTHLLKDINPGPANGVIAPQFCIYDNHLYFVATNSETGSELWKTDGTPEGTTLVKDIAPGQESSKPINLVATEDYLYFSAYTAAHGYEIWQSQGLSSNTNLLSDVRPGIPFSNPGNFIQLDDYLVFTALSDFSGPHVFSLRMGTTTDTEENLFRDLKIYPNPSSGLINIQTEIFEGGTATLFDLNGRPVYVYAMRDETNELNLQSLPAGLYFLKFVKGQKTASGKIIKVD